MRNVWQGVGGIILRGKYHSIFVIHCKLCLYICFPLLWSCDVCWEHVLTVGKTNTDQRSFSPPCQAAVDIISQLMSVVCVRDRSMGPYTGLFIRLNPLSTIDCSAVDKGFGPPPGDTPGDVVCHSLDRGHTESRWTASIVVVRLEKKGLGVLVRAVFNGRGVGNTNVYSHSWAALY